MTSRALGHTLDEEAYAQWLLSVIPITLWNLRFDMAKMVVRKRPGYFEKTYKDATRQELNTIVLLIPELGQPPKVFGMCGGEVLGERVCGLLPLPATKRVYLWVYLVCNSIIPAPIPD